MANRGTLYLDEIGEASNTVQIQLMNVIENKGIRRLGQNRVRPVDVRIIASSNSTIDNLAREGRVRVDLLYRLSVIPIDVPPLRERKQDIPLLVEHFLKHYQRQYQKRIEITIEALSTLEKYDYPGNIRELENIIARSISMLSGNKIALKDITIPKEIQGTLLTIFTNIFAASLNHDIIVLCHDRRDWMHPERFIM